MSNPLYVALGFTKVEIATIAEDLRRDRDPGRGGDRRDHRAAPGVFRALLIGGVLQALSNLM